MKKYNIALLPVNNNGDFTELAQKLSMLNPVYHLGDKSLPHVTLCQFYLDEKNVDATWEELCAALSDHELELEFKDFSFLTFDYKMFWIALLPTDVSELHKMQAKAAAVLKLASKKPYDPHLTLISTHDNSYKSKAAPLSEKYKPIRDSFFLALGECDELGQFVSVIHTKEFTEGLRLRD